MRIGVALGSNLGDRLAKLQRARSAIYSLPMVSEPFLSSAVYATAPVGCESDAGEFLNAVLEIGYRGELPELMMSLRRIEADLGRPAPHERNENRTIDIDLLYADDIKINQPDLTIPHPRMTTRLFVLQPLAQIRPELILPGQERSMAELAALLANSDQIKPLTNDW